MKRLFFIMAFLMLILSCASLRTVKYLTPNLDDSTKFSNVRIQRSSAAFHFI